MESGKIYQSLGAVMKTVAPIEKGQKNQQQGFMFRGIDDFMNTLHGKMAENGIIIIPKELDHIQDSYKSVNARGEEKLQFRSRVHMEYTFTSTEDGSHITADGWGEAADNGDKGYNKCKAIALKYILMQMFLIPTKDIVDPDSETPDPVVSATREDPELELALQMVREARSVEALQKVWKENTGMQTNKTFYVAVQQKNRELSANTGA